MQHMRPAHAVQAKKDLACYPYFRLYYTFLKLEFIRISRICSCLFCWHSSNKPQKKLSKLHIIIEAHKITVGIRGTSCVSIYSLATGINSPMASVANTRLITVKNSKGRFSRNNLNIVIRTLEPSLKVFSFETLPCVRSLYSIGISFRKKLCDRAKIVISVSTSNSLDSTGKFFTKSLEKAL